MGCGDSKGLTAKETTINNKTVQQNLSKNEKSEFEDKRSIKNNNVLTENNIAKDDENNLYKDKINLIYYSDESKDYIYDIFGENFVKNNKDNVDLLIDGCKQKELFNECILFNGETKITIIIKNKLTNLSSMFEGCYTLKDYSELKYLDVSQANDFSSMFASCTQITDFNFLKNWNVSKSKTFFKMFNFCQSLIDIKGLENWDVSNCENFNEMFYGCK